MKIRPWIYCTLIVRIQILNENSTRNFRGIFVLARGFAGDDLLETLETITMHAINYHFAIGSL